MPARTGNERGGEPRADLPERLAPVIPLFRDATRGDVAGWAGPPGLDDPAERPGDHAERPNDPAEGPGGSEQRLDESEERRDEFGERSDESEERAGGAAVGRASAEQALVKMLRRRPLSVAEARAELAEHRLAGEDVDRVISDFRRRGYLDDAALAEQLVRAGAERKRQGRAVLARTLAQRGIPSDVAQAVLGALPDDETERALVFARSKARAAGARDRDAAVRRLAGQLSRRGYSSSTALTAARRAVDELGTSASRTGGDHAAGPA